MNRLFGLLAMVLLAWGVAPAETPTPVDQDRKDQKLDSLLRGQDRLIKAVVIEDPFIEKRAAITFNLPLFIATYGRNERILSGSFSFFPKESPFEFALPVWYRADESDMYYQRRNDFSALVVDAQARYYLDPLRHGLYVVGGFRQVWMEGYREDIGDYWRWDDPDYNGPTVTEDVSRNGLYAGVGWRARSSRIYWSTNIVLGRYFGGKVPLEGDDLLGEDYLLDVEFFRIGILF